jgi:hypothetical protein
MVKSGLLLSGPVDYAALEERARRKPLPMRR